jgi:hypothetical protein
MDNEPIWTYPYATRRRVNLAYARLAKIDCRNWKDNPRPRVLYQHRKNKIPWESVRPDLRPQVQQWFDNKIAEYKALGRPITQGIINSVRCNATRYGRQTLTHRYSAMFLHWKTSLHIVTRYEEWLAQQQRSTYVGSLGKTQSRQLEL